MPFFQKRKNAAMDSLTLKVVGLNHTITISVRPTATVADLKAKIESQTLLPTQYQRLISRGKKLEDDTVVLGEGGAGIQTRTKIMLLHNEFYATDKKGIDAIAVLTDEIKVLEEKIAAESLEQKVVDELITRVCCKLDCVDTNGSERLRAMRKEAIRKAESLAQ
uniref:Ubiquitin-like domain-containing protein n=1 Tax=Ditylum brightwellii TaxID=49249 RepID=A0A7S4V6Q1_9STRA